MIWRGWRRGWEVVMKVATTKHMGPQVNCEAELLALDLYH
jgi:hypothetical protein